MWVWQSINPGSTVALPRSITVVPGGTGRLLPTAVIRVLSIRITGLDIGGPPRPSINRPARTARCRAELSGFCAERIDGVTLKARAAKTAVLNTIVAPSKRLDRKSVV